MIKNSPPGAYLLVNLSAIDIAHVVVTKAGSLTLIIKIGDRSITFCDSEAIDLLSAMRLSPPDYHIGNLSNTGEDWLPI